MCLADALADGRVLLADGAMATNLFAAGLALGEPPDAWTLTQPDRIADLHQRFAEAGADVLLTNSFGGNTARLRLNGLAGEVRDINLRAAQLARAIADAAGRRIVVAGAVGPTGERLAPCGTLGEEAARDMFVAQIAALAEGGADVAWIETMSDLAEMRAAARAAADVGLPFVLTASFGADGATLAGVSPDAFAAFAAGLSPAPVAIGANCGTGPAGVLDTIAALALARPGIPRVAKPNAGLPEQHGQHLLYGVGPSDMAAFATRAAQAGAAVVGGCCGTTPAHVAAMRRAIDRLGASDHGSEAVSP